jgi:rRNA maturation endonuclease Nob1
MPEDKRKKRCPICDAELDEDEDVCPNCGCYIEEPCYDAMDDEGN